ncbi:hypothetical protein [Clostridium sp. AWRP]|uniref:hyaluronate lyase N-terminal domain-containing protein n=1 Tax=Clostridium sp. AWRP TaxID=2212991 RepID=UPI000FD8BA79|nr:hypothetical protein [Clostridium sp. AWRP]AZV58822.1 hypothetical protein DMR38_20800 [Clostridium sp. AWRP]
MSIIKFKRGIKSNLPVLSVGEPAFCTDTKELFVGSSEGNVNLSNVSKVNGHTASGTPTTSEKTDIIKMINEVFTDANNGKTKLYNAIIGKGITPGSQTFTDLVNAINTPSLVNTAGATATTDDIVSNKAAYVNGNKITGTGNKAKRFVSGTITADSQGNFMTFPEFDVSTVIISFTSSRGIKMTGVFINNGRSSDYFVVGSDGKTYKYDYDISYMQGRVFGTVDANVDISYKIYE